MGRDDDVPLAFENRMERHESSVVVVSVFDFVIKYFVTFDHGRQLGDVDALLLHREVLRLRVVPDGQVPLAFLKRVPYGLYRQILLVRTKNASLRVTTTTSIVPFFGTFLPLSIVNDVNAVLNTPLRFHESQFDVAIIKLLVHNTVAGCSKQDLHQFRSLITIN